MRLRNSGIMALAIVVSGARVAASQYIEGPPLVPSMVPAERYIAEAISTPWYPPPHLPTPAVPGNTASTAAAENAVTELPGVDELPGPVGEELSDEIDRGLASDVLVDEPPVWYRPAQWFGPIPWDTGIELGVNGSSGTKDSISVRTGGYIKRESRFSKLDLSGYYNNTTNSGETTQNNATLDVRNDWLLDDASPWTLYGTGNVFYDEFQAFDAQVNANTGVGYRFVHDPQLSMIGRLGAGASREIGGPDDRWVPESLVGFEYNQQLSATQKIYGKVDYFPEFDEVGEFRMVADVGWEVELVQPSNLSLKISATDRYDSTPNGADPHLLNYSALLLLKL